MKSSHTKRLLLIPFSFCVSISSCGFLPTTPAANSDSQSTVAAKPAAVKDLTYPVVAGDTLRGISVQTTGTTQNWDIIAGYNKLAYPYALRIGQQIRIPGRLLLTKPAASVRRPPPKPVIEDVEDGPPLATVSAPAAKVTPSATGRTAAGRRTTSGSTAASSAGRGAAELKDSPPKTAAAEPTPDSGWITITGSYYPREVKMQPSSGADYLMLVRPGSRVRYTAREGDWYKVITDRGEGFVEAEHALEQ